LFSTAYSLGLGDAGSDLRNRGKVWRGHIHAGNLSPLATSAFRKAAALRQGGSITRAVQDANDHDLSFVVQIVDGVIARKTDAQARRKILSR